MQVEKLIILFEEKIARIKEETKQAEREGKWSTAFGLGNDYRNHEDAVKMIKRIVREDAEQLKLKGVGE